MKSNVIRELKLSFPCLPSPPLSLTSGDRRGLSRFNTSTIDLINDAYVIKPYKTPKDRGGSRELVGW